TAARLAALGYVGASAGSGTPASNAGAADPKPMIGGFNPNPPADAPLPDRGLAGAAAISREALAGDPRNAFATIVLANAEMEQGRYREAIAGYRAYLDLVPDNSDAHHRTAICYARLGDPDLALAEEDAALAIDPRNADSHTLRGGLLATRGRTE